MSLKNKRDQIKAKRLLQGALINKSSQLHKKADNLNKAAEFDPDDYDNFEDNTDAATGTRSSSSTKKRSSSKSFKGSSSHT